MKTILRISLTTCILIIFSISVLSETTNDPRKTNDDNPRGITYVVVEVDATNMTGLCHSYRIIVIDENGMIVDEPKVYHEGITKYIFREMGPVTGERTAILEVIPDTSPNTCNQNLYSVPDTQSNRFGNGQTYLFYLYPEISVAITH